MKIDVISVDEETGVIELDVDDEAKQYLIERGFNTVIMEALKRLEEDERRKTEGV